MLELILYLVIYLCMLFLFMEYLFNKKSYRKLSIISVKRLLSKEDGDLVIIDITHSEMGDQQMVYASYKGKFIVFRKKNNNTYVSLHTFPTPTYLGNVEALIAYLSLLTNKPVKAVYTPN